MGRRGSYRNISTGIEQALTSLVVVLPTMNSLILEWP